MTIERSSGILLPITALPSPHGIGTLGKEARNFIDFLASAKQRWWQVLPVGPTAYGNSPYQSPSAYAGNPWLIDLELLVEEGILTKKDLNAGDTALASKAGSKIDYEAVKASRPAILRKAFEKGRTKDTEQQEAFRRENADWLEDYTLFMALKEHFGDLSWQEWPDEAIRMRDGAAMDAYRERLGEEMAFHRYVQYLFFTQWAAMKAYAKEKGVLILGDLPIYVALDSADVWAAPQEFMLDEKNMPIEISGVPPDYFSEEGQLWGNPLYNYAEQAKNGYGWWIRRIGGAQKLYDAIRIDHFRGFASFWAVPSGEKTAKNGRWIKGPGMDLLRVLTGWFSGLSFVAEDLGILTPDVTALREEAGFPGMKILAFAFDANDQSSYLPHRYERNCVCYAGTHDNDTILGWAKTAPKADLDKARAYLGLNKEEGLVWGILRGGISSVADLFVAQMQDYLELGTEARMNTPGTVGGNWEWRLSPGQANAALAKRIAAMTELYGRA